MALVFAAPSGPSLAVAGRGSPRCGTRVSHRGGVCRCRAQAPRCLGSAVAAHGPWSVGSAVVARGHSCSVACGIFSDHKSNPPPALAGGFLSPVPSLAGELWSYTSCSQKTKTWIRSNIKTNLIKTFLKKDWICLLLSWIFESKSYIPLQPALLWEPYSLESQS